jgi:peptidoglycan-associated lipoprotein
MVRGEDSVMNDRFRLSAALVLVAALTAGACGKKKPETPPPAAAPAAPAPAPTTPPPPPPPPPPPAPPAETPLTEDQIFDRMTLDDLNKQAPLADVFFAYDATDLSDEARAALAKNLDWLKRRASTKVLVEGHADNRGTNEYNLALGERRADAVRDYLISLGIPADRLTIVSKGEEQPFCADDSETCWQENRRGHFIFTAK